MGLTSKIISMGGKEWFRLGLRGRQCMEYFGVEGGSGGGLRGLTLKVGETIIVAEATVGLTVGIITLRRTLLHRHK